MVEYPFKELDQLELAYAITIHKSQGSEYPAVIIPLLTGPRMLMNRNLLYTAVTRARKCVTLVGDEKAFYNMEANVNEQKRYSGLRRPVGGVISWRNYNLNWGKWLDYLYPPRCPVCDRIYADGICADCRKKLFVITE